ncbi:unnamed protein product [Orchesella dallaii]|uniref:Arrestin C-terminal-like domain-containing protein n=1 Tax=Orchesella dallaii TaxID=48710 RepID=A0ABP1QMW8_9HEXA
MVSGKVVIQGNGEKTTQGMTLKFEGNVRVHWTVRKTERGTGSGSDRTVTHNYNDWQRIFEFQNYLLGDGRSDVEIPAGESSYPFSFQLPPMNLPSSYMGIYGKVEYLLEANVIRSWKFDYNTKQYITVNGLVDLNNYPQAAEPGECETSKTFCCWCCATGPLCMTVRLKKRGFVPGEMVPLEVEVNNLSNRGVSDISAELVQEASFFAQGARNYSVRPVISVKRGKGVDPGDRDIWRLEMVVPFVPPTNLGGCRLIDVQYVLMGEIHVSGVAFNLRLSCPVMIGTIPFRAKVESTGYRDDPNCSTHVYPKWLP